MACAGAGSASCPGWSGFSGSRASSTTSPAKPIFPLLPLYLASLGAGMGTLGLVEGSADALASLVKVAAGRISDRGPRRLLVVGGYALPALARAGIAAALRPAHVLAARLVDRLGKGIRSAPRDALLADADHRGDVGRAFGLQRSLDHLGAAFGPLAASLLLASGASIRGTFLAAAGLGFLAPLLLLARLGEPRSGGPARPRGAPPAETRPADALPRRFWRYLAAAALFSLANSSDAFLVAKASEVGFAPSAVPLLWFGHHVLKTLTGAPGGALSDRLPRGRVVASGWAAYAIAYLGFAFASSRLSVALLFGFYALYHGLTEAAERALVADTAGQGLRGRAYGWYHGAVGLGALPASLLTGWLWERHGSTVALGASGLLAAAAALGLALSPGIGWRAEADRKGA